MSSDPLSAARHQGGVMRGLRARWPLLRKILFIAFALLVIGLLVDRARDVEWEKVMEAVEANTWPVLLRASGWRR